MMHMHGSISPPVLPSSGSSCDQVPIDTDELTAAQKNSIHCGARRIAGKAYKLHPKVLIRF
jgi:hypothetical protein